MTEQDLESSARYLHAQSIVVDALNTPHPPGAPDFETFVDYVRRGGVIATPTRAYRRPARSTSALPKNTAKWP